MTLYQITECDRLTVSPVFLSTKGENSEHLNSLFKDTSVIICDELKSQLSELIELQNPSIDYGDEELVSAVDSHLKGVSSVDYGLWVYYPWMRRLVHVLPEDEFVQCRTNRNKYKITDKEQQLLSKKVVGVVGLSVGQSVSLTMAMERSFGELRIADFDDLELTNLNRIRTGVHNLGLPKTTVVAREIAEIDPFLKVSVFEEGLTEDNIDSFLTGGSKMDLLIDECDGLDMKIIMRVHAKKLRIPVLMDMSDRGTLDIERYDIEPEYPILHGLIGDMNIAKLKALETYEDKIPYLLKMIDARTISPRLKASMIEIGTSITTWPQLASAVCLGGALGADVSRRLFTLGKVESGRYHVDLSELTLSEDKVQLDEIESPNVTFKSHSKIEFPREVIPLMDVLEVGCEMDSESVRSVFEELKTSPSAGNTQPWIVCYQEGNFVLFVKRSNTQIEKLASVNFGMIYSVLNLLLSQRGFKVELDSKMLDTGVFAVLKLSKANGAEVWRDFIPYMSMRTTLRDHSSSYQKVSLPSELIRELDDLLKTNKSGNYIVLDSKTEMKEVIDLITFSDLARMLSHVEHAELFSSELTFDDDQSSGIKASDLGLDSKDLAGIEVIGDPKVANLMNELEIGFGMRKMIEKKVESSDCFLAFSSSTDDLEGITEASQFLYFAWLLFAKYGFAFHPYTSVCFIENTSGQSDFRKSIIEKRDAKRKELGLPDKLIFFTRVHRSALALKNESNRISLENFVYESH